MGITVNAVCPGLIETDILLASGAEAAASMGMTYDEMVEQFSGESSIKRMNTVEEVGAVAVLLASDIGAGITARSGRSTGAPPLTSFQPHRPTASEEGHDDER